MREIDNKNFVFLMECKEFAQARVLKSFLESQGLHPRVRDEQFRSIAPHLENALGRLILEVPEHEFMQASLLVEKTETGHTPSSPSAEASNQDATDISTHSLSKKCLWNAVLGLFIVPVFCNVYSMTLGFRVLGKEMPLSNLSKRRLLIAMLLNSIAFYFWLTIGFKTILAILNKNSL